jgi:hypothetical protein
MHAILNALHQRIFNLEIALQTNNQISNRSQTMMDNNLSSPKTNIMISQELDQNSIDPSPQRSTRNSFVPDQHSPNFTLEKQLHQLNLSSPAPFEQSTIGSVNPPNNSLHSDF